MRLLLAAMFLLQAAPAQSEAEKLEAALKKFGERTYRVVEKGKESGTVTLKTRIETVGDRKVAVFEDTFVMKIGENEATLIQNARASMNGLRLLSADRTARNRGREASWSISVADGKVFLKIRDRERTIEVTEATVEEHAVPRLVCSSEQKEGTRFKADVISFTDEEFQPGHTFHCLGKEQIEIGGRKVDAFKWRQLWYSKEARKVDGKEVPSDSSVNATWWISPEGYPLRYKIDGTEFVLDSK